MVDDTSPTPRRRRFGPMRVSLSPPSHLRASLHDTQNQRLLWLPCTAQMPFRSAAQREKLNRIPACSFTSSAPNRPALAPPVCRVGSEQVSGRNGPLASKCSTQYAKSNKLPAPTPHATGWSGTFCQQSRSHCGPGSRSGGKAQRGAVLVFFTLVLHAGSVRF